MTNKLGLIIAAATMLTAPQVFAAETIKSSTETQLQREDNGDYKAKTVIEKQDATGTDTKEETTSKLKTDSDGNVSKTETTETVTDPKGLMNKKTTKVTDEVADKDDGTRKHKHQKKVNGSTVEETVIETK